jgi:hypothetical protein
LIIARAIIYGKEGNMKLHFPCNKSMHENITKEEVGCKKKKPLPLLNKCNKPTYMTKMKELSGDNLFIFLSFFESLMLLANFIFCFIFDFY